MSWVKGKLSVPSYETDRPMTVGELIEALRQHPEHLPVYTEGCDCDGPAASLEFQPPEHGVKPHIYLKRERT